MDRTEVSHALGVYACHGPLAHPSGASVKGVKGVQAGDGAGFSGRYGGGHRAAMRRAAGGGARTAITFRAREMRASF